VASDSYKRFNTVGPCIPNEHYILPVLPRLPDIDDMITGKFYFVLHAPRQSGKTTFLDFLTDKINSDGQMYAINISLATLRNAFDKLEGLNGIINRLNAAMRSSQIDIIKQKAFTYNSSPGMSAPEYMVQNILNRLCEDLDKDLIVFFDEADCLQEAPLIQFLSQIRDGYNIRHKKGNKFPRTIALVGMRDIRDYLSQVRPDEQSKGVFSPFNIKKEALTLSNFTQEDIGSLYRQHTEATGQVFEESAIAKAWYLSEGQPWLVNALADEIVVNHLKNNYSIIITKQHIVQSAQSLILRNDTHFDSLKERLREPRVRRVIEAVVIGAASFPEGISDDDIKYSLDLGLLKKDLRNNNIYLPANPIYQEIIVRFLSTAIQKKISTTIPDSYQSEYMDETSLDMNGLLKSFQSYWSENCEMYIKSNMIDSLLINSIDNALHKLNLTSHSLISEEIIKTIQDSLIGLANEALTHLVLFAFLQRVLNGGADFIQSEYALGALRVNICISYKDRRYPIELKIKGHKSENESLEQLYGYMNKSRAE
jgi:hypothetical protein